MALGNRKLALSNCQPSQEAVKFCQLPLFDGVLIFTGPSTFDQKLMEFEFLISGWSIEQMEQFLLFVGTLWPDADIVILDDDDKMAIADKKLDYLNLIDKLGALTASGMDMGGDGTVEGDEYRAVRMEICAGEILRYL